MEPPVYFVGLTLPNAFERKVVTVQKELFDEKTMRRPLIPHVTLLPPPVFQGIDPDSFITLAQEATHAMLPLAVTLKNVTGSRSLIRIDVELSPQLRSLHRILADLLPAKKRPTEPFVPHVTLAQSKNGQRLAEALVKEYSAKLMPTLPMGSGAYNLALFTWQRPRVYSIRLLSHDGA